MAYYYSDQTFIRLVYGRHVLMGVLDLEKVCNTLL